MVEILSVLPLAFWAVIALLGSGSYFAARQVRQGLGIPMLALLATIAFWYVGDALYNDYTNNHMTKFTSAVLQKAWWQVAGFLAVFCAVTPFLHRMLNRQLFKHSSQALHLYKTGVEDPQFQRALSNLFIAAAVVWACLLAFATIRFRGRYFDYLFPYLGEHPGPWVASALASGVGDSLLALAGNLQLMVGCLFGVVLALSTKVVIRSIALVGVFLTWPFFIFAITRNQMLIPILAGALSWVFLRLRYVMFVKVVILACLFALINAWFGFVIANRSKGTTTSAMAEVGFKFSEGSGQEHEGLNMFEELCWIDSFMEAGSINPRWGADYFAEFANPIPRFLWAGKPTIGLDYAKARGGGGADNEIGVSVTISDGMIGQGVMNFGYYIGPPVAAVLMGLWACWLARIDLLGKRIGYFPLYGLGLTLTFVMGRDVGPLALYPFLFGFGICWWLNRGDENRNRERRPNPNSKRRPDRRGRHNTPSIGSQDVKGATPSASPSQADV